MFQYPTAALTQTDATQPNAYAAIVDNLPLFGFVDRRARHEVISATTGYCKFGTSFGALPFAPPEHERSTKRQSGKAQG